MDKYYHCTLGLNAQSNWCSTDSVLRCIYYAVLLFFKISSEQSTWWKDSYKKYCSSTQLSISGDHILCHSSEYEPYLSSQTEGEREREKAQITLLFLILHYVSNTVDTFTYTKGKIILTLCANVSDLVVSAISVASLDDV